MTKKIRATAEVLAFEPTMDEQDFQELYEEYNRPLYNFFANRGYCREESRDLVQDTFLAAYGSRASFRGDSPPRNWLFGIAANVWREAVRDRQRLKRDARVVSLDALAHGAESESTRAAEIADAAQESRPLRKCLADERTRLLWDALKELPERMRLCMDLYLRGYKYREIADVQEISLNTVRTQLFDAREKLRVRLADHFQDLDVTLAAGDDGT